MNVPTAENESLNNMNKYLFFMSLLLAALYSSRATAQANSFETATITLFNNGPVMNLIALSRPDFMPASPAKSVTLRAQYELTNYISSTAKGPDVFYIDGETLTLRHTLSYQIDDALQIGFSIPWIEHSGGMADQFIFDFHDIFQLPQNGRTESNEDDLRWRLLHNGERLLRVDDRLSGWGDLSITAQLTPSSKPSARWTFMTKLPTGDFDKQTGSGKFDAGISFTEMNPEWFKTRNTLSGFDLAFWYGAGINYVGQINRFRSLDQSPFVATLRTGIAYAPFKHWHIKTQLDSQSPLYNTEIRELGWFPMMISFASSHLLSTNTQLEFVIIEDLRPRSAPDVIFQSNFQIRF
jgi:hypothetical protein